MVTSLALPKPYPTTPFSSPTTTIAAKNGAEIVVTPYTLPFANTLTQEEKELLLSLLKKADENGLLYVYDNNENTFEVTWVYLDNEICIKIKEL